MTYIAGAGLPSGVQMFSSSIGQVNINYNTEVTLPISGISQDPLGWGGGLVCPKAGQYFFFARCWFPSMGNPGTGHLHMNVWKNGATLFGGWDASANTAFAVGMYAAFQTFFNQGDQLTLRGYQGISGSNPQVGGNDSQVNIVFIPTQAYH